MQVLTKDRRSQLAKVVLAAREAVEAAASKALRALGVDEPDAPGHLTPELRTLRRALRAQARQLGDHEDPRKKGSYQLTHLTEKIAYDQWHRMLFARFLAENNLLISPKHGVSVSLEDCRDLAPEIGLRDGWEVAARFAAGMLPQIFRADDPAGQIELPPEDRNALQQLVTGLERETFLADDALGWVYQFWQAKRKEEVNRSEKKIGADELPAVTQLFTEDYMVLFLLHNTLGAWWAGKQLKNRETKNLSDEGQVRSSLTFPGIEWTYLRFVRNDTGEWRPAAGTFEGWPQDARKLRVLDPCMGSGHFLVFALPILVRFRMEEEGLSIAEACDAVLRENLFGLEIDARCTQIAAFNLAFAGWKMAGYRQLPPLNLACSGLAINARKEVWLQLAKGDDKLVRGMELLYNLFEQAPVLGSLIAPGRIGGDLLVAEFNELEPLLERALAHEEAKKDENIIEIGVTARGLAHAAEILACQFSLVATNVPYLGRGKQGETLKQFCDRNYPKSRNNLASVFLEKCMELLSAGGTTALVLLNEVLSLGGYKKLRCDLLNASLWEFVIRLGSRAFEGIGGERVSVCLLGITSEKTGNQHRFVGIDVAEETSALNKGAALPTKELGLIPQAAQLKNPDYRITLEEKSDMPLLRAYADSFVGLQNGDTPRYIINFWELQQKHGSWEFFQLTTDSTTLRFGREGLLRWDRGKGELVKSAGARIQGTEAWGKCGIAVRIMGNLPATLYEGDLYDQSSAAIVPKSESNLPAMWSFCSSQLFNREVRKVDQKLNVTNATLVKVPFDLSHWQRVASEKYPDGLPKPHSDELTQWLFGGHPKGSDQPLHVAVTRLLGYRWPRQTGSSFPDCPALGPDGLETFADVDGVVCLSPVRGEEPASERLRALLEAAYGPEWSTTKQAELLEQVEYAGKTLDDWLRNGFFEQHCKVFHQRPFIWHIWDGLKNGFSVLVNYHKLNRTNLEKLIYTYLGDWIVRQRAAVDTSEEGSDVKLTAANELKEKLEKILEGEPPYDIFVRWKPLEKQPIGWEADLNDGVRLNIRPFMTAGVLRKNPNIKWNKDRGKDVSSAPWYKIFNGERINDYHFTLEEKRRTRQKG